ncbi:trypsin-like peptidase domain-containing protein [Streptomyces sp. NPDC020983]|uniref:VMAP-C domain-containing protein n=1 Tax=Streptomyces sp. NPDC020983 TaxID=3365106 RepID=UPI0037A0B77C
MGEYPASGHGEHHRHPYAQGHAPAEPPEPPEDCGPLPPAGERPVRPAPPPSAPKRYGRPQPSGPSAPPDAWPAGGAPPPAPGPYGTAPLRPAAEPPQVPGPFAHGAAASSAPAAPPVAPLAGPGPLEWAAPVASGGAAGQHWPGPVSAPDDGVADPDAPVRAAWVAVCSAADGTLAGAGVVVADGVVLTCAHVVNAALGRDRLAAAEPGDAELGAVALVLPAAGPGRHRPTLVRWDAPRAAARSGVWDGDLALLRLPADAPAVPPVRLGEVPFGGKAWAWYATGDGRTAVDVHVQKTLGPWLLLDPGSAQLAVRPGYSGGPLWDSAAGALVGVMVGVEHEFRRYYAIGPAAVRTLLAGAGLAPAGPRSPHDAWLHARLTGALGALPPERHSRGAELLAWALRLPGGPPRTAHEAADAALAHPRGLPALRDAFADPAAPEAGPVERELAEAVAGASPVRLLGPDDHARLSALLAAVPLPGLLAAARAAVPYLPLYAGRVPDTAALLDQLEDRAAEPGVMPPLLQVVEETAALRADLRAGLHEWSGRVAARLRVRPGALEQVRADARARARTRARALPVLRVWLWERGRDAFSYVIRLYDGDDRPLHTWSAEDTPRRHTDLCAELADAVRTLADQGQNAGVEFLLEHGSFGLPFDRWPIPVPEVGPRMLGTDHVVVLRGQRRPSRGPWERRWGSLGSAASVVGDAESADELLGEDLDAALVLAACAPSEIDRVLGLCRHYGVPVVLWHRQGEGDAGALLELVGDDWRRSLREEVRRRRVKARNDERKLGAHLALLWEDPRWDPRRAGLAEPVPLD